MKLLFFFFVLLVIGFALMDLKLLPNTSGLLVFSGFIGGVVALFKLVAS